MGNHRKVVSDAYIEELRRASRLLARELGFMSPTLADSSFSASGVHALIEIETCGGCNAGDLATALRLEKSTVSRMLRKLVIAGEIEERIGVDGRVNDLRLTRHGKTTVKAIHDFARRQVTGALGCVPASRHQEILNGLALYANALQTHRLGQPAIAPSISVVHGYATGAIGRIAEMHATYYARHAGFGRFFETKVAREVAEFCSRLDHDANGLWLAKQGERIVGSIVIDGEDDVQESAHLRWFIMDDSVRGLGIGRKLMTSAMEFCAHRRYDTVVLWTFKGLDAARHLYESFGFHLAEETRAAQWGTEVPEQRFVRVSAESSKQIRM